MVMHTYIVSLLACASAVLRRFMIASAYGSDPQDGLSVPVQQQQDPILAFSTEDIPVLPSSSGIQASIYMMPAFCCQAAFDVSLKVVSSQELGAWGISRPGRVLA